MTIFQRSRILMPVTFPVLLAYIYTIHVIHGVKRGDMSRWRLVLAWPAVLLFGLLDIAYNWTVGTIIFVEWPRELMYTARLKRHIRGPDGDRKTYAEQMCKELNRWDEGHC